jgi:hypothetical protein
MNERFEQTPSLGEGIGGRSRLAGLQALSGLSASEFGQLHQNPYLYTDKSDI